MFKDYYNIESKILGPGLKTGIQLKVDDPKTVGADMIFLHQAFFVPAIGKKIGQTWFFQIHFFDNRFPFIVMNMIFL